MQSLGVEVDVASTKRDELAHAQAGEGCGEEDRAVWSEAAPPASCSISPGE